MEQSRSEHILQLAKELLDDIELNRLSAEALLLKSSRLARWVGSDEIKYWIHLEMNGYDSSNEISLKYMVLTGRWLKNEEGTGFWGPLAQQAAALEAENIKLRSMTTPKSMGSERLIFTNFLLLYSLLLLMNQICCLKNTFQTNLYDRNIKQSDPIDSSG